MTWILPLVALGAALSFVGEFVNRAIFPREASKATARGWRRAWYLSLPLHAPALAAAIGAAATSIPVPESFGDGAAGRALYFGLGGIFSPTLYNLARGFLKAATEKAAEGGS
jgi:hypothetical protein